MSKGSLTGEEIKLLSDHGINYPWSAWDMLKLIKHKEKTMDTILRKFIMSQKPLNCPADLTVSRILGYNEKSLDRFTAMSKSNSQFIRQGEVAQYLTLHLNIKRKLGIWESMDNVERNEILDAYAEEQ